MVCRARLRCTSALVLSRRRARRYGTSIVNGHVASRPGMIFTTVLGRKLARGVINLGFGGNGEMERSVIKVMSQLKQAALVVIDCNWNMDPDHIRHNATSVVAQLRAEWSATKPIVMAGRKSPLATNNLREDTGLRGATQSISDPSIAVALCFC